jgi:N utilization substance protein B
MTWKHEERHGAREAALQILYQWEVGGASVADTLAAYWDVRERDPDDSETGAVDREYAAMLVRGTADRIADLDPLIEEQAEHWRLSRMAVIDRLILRQSAYELRYVADAPPAVIINEALELARTFSSEESVRFINGVLDALAKKQRGKGSPREL